MTYDDLLALARRFAGRPLETVTGKRLTVGIYPDCSFFTPESTWRAEEANQRHVRSCGTGLPRHRARA